MSRRWPASLWLGAGLIVLCELLLIVDVRGRGVAVLPLAEGETMADPVGVWAVVARWVAVNMTPLCWVGFLLAADGLLEVLRRRPDAESRNVGSPVRSRSRRFTIALVTSVGVWLFFDWVNFFFINAWAYHGFEPLGRLHQTTAKLIAFAAISPAMFLAAELYRQLGLSRCRGGGVAISRRWQILMLLGGILALAFPFLIQRPIGCLTLWVCLVLLLDPINHWLGAPSLIRDWSSGRWGRTLALMAGGLTCGFFWEFWNYWAAAKWTYTLPFLGPLQEIKLFEMPLAGFGGFLPFGLECWVAFQSILLVMDKIGLRVAEPLPDDDAVL